MNKPPEKLYLNVDILGRQHPSASEWKNQDVEKTFTYTLEEPMEKKTENLTEKEAWVAMARGSV